MLLRMHPVGGQLGPQHVRGGGGEQHVVFADSVKAHWRNLRPPIQAKIVKDAVVAAAIVQIDVPSVMAAPARVGEVGWLDSYPALEARHVCRPSACAEIDALSPPAVTAPGIE